MKNEYLVDIAKVDKTFFTRHFLQKDEDTGKRVLYRVKAVCAARGIEFGIRPGAIFGDSQT